MTVRVHRVRGGSGFLRPGDEIVSIDGHPVRDQLDALFLSAGEGTARVAVRRRGRLLSRVVDLAALAGDRVAFDEMRFIRCRSKCIFCFMDQMPRGLRPSLYEKDDDYRLSFLFGNFVTLNDVRDADIARIVEMGLSPLYVSVHAVRPAIRERLFGRPMRRDIVRDLRRLARSGITIHAQIVLVPGVNDGPSLRETVRALAALYPACRSIAVVPVGITAHRAQLPPLRRVSVDESRALIDWASRERERLKERTGGDPLLHLADELYLVANRALPPAGDYGEFPQLSNGVGSCRRFLMDLERDIVRAGRRGGGPPAITIATGVLGARFLRRYALPRLAGLLPETTFKILAVRNRLLGSSVTVSGLLAGRDIIRAARREGVAGCLVIPPNALNGDGRFIDDVRLRDISRELRVTAVAARSTFLEARIARRCTKGLSS